MILVSGAMEKSGLIFAASFLIASHALMGQSNSATSGSWSGVIVNSDCTLDEAFAEAAEVHRRPRPGAKLVLYDDTIRQLYTIWIRRTRPPVIWETALRSEATLEGNTIHVASFKLLTAIGLDVGQKAPAFSARDQFGQEQNSRDPERDPRARFSSSSVPPIGDPTAKGSWSSCKAPKQDLRSKGLKIAAISYDSEEILKYFAGPAKDRIPVACRS